MNEIFKYNSLNAFLKPSTKTLIISTKAETHQQGLSLEWLFEVDSILQWAFDKIEIQSILLTGELDGFSPSFHKNEVALKEKEFLSKIYQKINALNKLLMKLPQTVILDCKNGSNNVAIDIAFSADVIIGHRNGQWNFNFLDFGLAPISIHLFGKTKIATSILDQWILTSTKVSHIELQAKQVIHSLYDETDRNIVIQNILEKILNQAPVTRIQAKLSLKRSFLEEIDRHITADFKIFMGTLMSEEWKLWSVKKNSSNKKATNHLKIKNLSSAIKKEDISQKLNNPKYKNVIPLRPGT